MIMEQLGPLPSAGAVLNKLKSDGTFDQFRKTCLASIETEPSFRAYGEHIEVVARRYLQNYKWRESTTKNQVRGKLKDHALGVIAGPDIHVGMPLSSLVEKVLQSKSKELLPKIMDIVDQLRETKPKSTPTKTPDTQSSSNPSTRAANLPTAEGVKVKPPEFGSLSLPIDIPGLSSSSPVSLKREGGASDGKPVKVKSKTAADGTTSSKDGKGGVKSKTGQGTSGSKPAVVVDSGKQKEKEKDDKGNAGIKGMDESSCKAKGTGKVKKAKDEPKEPAVVSHKELAVVSHKEPAVGAGHKEEVTESKGMKSTHLPGKDAGDNTNVPKEGEDKETGKEELKERKSEKSDTKTSVTKSTHKGKEKEASKGKVTETTNEEKVAVTTRRSARLASLTEVKEDDNKDKTETAEVQTSESVSSETAAAVHEESEANKAVKGRKRPRKTNPSGQKKARVISSSSEGSVEQADDKNSSDNDDKQIVEQEKKRSVKGSKRKVQSAKSNEANNSKTNSKSGRSSRKRALQQTQEESVELHQPKKPKRKRAGSKSPVEEVQEEQDEEKQEIQSQPNKRKSHPPKRLPQRASNSPPVVVTRYNRHVKPNRRYLDVPGDGDEANKSEEEEEGEKESDKEEEVVRSGVSDFESEEEVDEEEEEDEELEEDTDDDDNDDDDSTITEDKSTSRPLKEKHSKPKNGARTKKA